MQTYAPNVPGAAVQMFDITLDPTGVIYLANLGGVVSYDGAWWRRVEIGRTQNAFSVQADGRGKIGVGGVDEIGYLGADERGSMRYTSLVPLLPAAERDFGQVLQVQATAEGFTFMTTRRLLVWDGRGLATVATFPGDRPYAVSYSVEGTVYVWTRAGVHRLAGRSLEPVPGGGAFAGRRVDQILAAPGGLLVSVRGEGLFLLRRGAVEPFAPEASRWAKEKRILAGALLLDGRWALGSILGGVLLLRPDGSIEQIVDTRVGLPDDFVNDLVVDREGALWAALNSGIVRLEIGSPLSLIDRRMGLEGLVYDLTRHRDHLWVGTAAGLFTNAPPALGGRMRAVPDISASTWGVLSLGDVLLAATAFGVFQVDDSPPARRPPAALPGTDQKTAFVLARARRDPDRVWIGMTDGLLAVRRQGGAWILEGAMPGFDDQVRTIEEDDAGTVWCSTSQAGVVGFQIPAGWPAAGAPKLRRVPGSDDSILTRIRGEIAAAAGESLLRLDTARGELVHDPRFRALEKIGSAFAATEDAEGNVWLARVPPAVALRRGAGWAPGLKQLIDVPARDVEQVVAEPDGVVWMASELGLIRHAGKLEGATPPLLPPLFSRVTLDGGKILFGGAPGAPVPHLALPAGARRFRLEYGPLAHRAGLRYQTRLLPVDEGWSAPAAEPLTELARLPAGDYTLAVRTVDPSEGVSPPSTLAFRVAAPWYLAPWALLLWLGTAVLAVAGYVRLRHRALRRRAAELEAQVAGQTLELRRTVEELRQAQADLEGANVQLEALSLQDDLTGIANRRRLQQVVEAEWSRARRHHLPIALCLLDLDHFKLLNDTRGHLEGDEALRRVAAYLAGAVRGGGDLVARYGGEEFAILLADTDEAQALELAERLRQGIEDLALPHDAVPGGRLTASFGVAAYLPGPEQRPESLFEAADHALYRAKTAGRNRACAGEAPGGAAGTRAEIH